MKTHARLLVYLAAALALCAVVIVAPGAWAEPLQERLGQTVPKPTFTWTLGPTDEPPPFVATSTPTRRSGNTPILPTDTPAPPAEGTAAPADTVTPEATPPATEAAVSPLALVKEVSRAEVWPGANVVFTLTLTNTSTASVRQVRLEDMLPEGLEPGMIQGPDADWEGRTLVVQRAVLPPSGRLTVVFAARVADDVPAGGVIVNQAVATAGASARPSVRVTASALLILPPIELPPTGGQGRGAEAPAANGAR